MIFHWGTDPEIFRIGSFAIRWYGLLFALSFVVGTYIIRSFFVKEGKPEKYIERLLIFMIVGTVVGARLGHTLFYEPDYYLSNPIEILKIWRGGLASHGAAIGILVSLFLYSKKTVGQPYLWVLDRMGIVTALGGGFIRLGNFFNSEIIGRPTGSDWGVVFERVDRNARHPAQLYESLCYFGTFALLFFLYRNPKLRNRQGFLIGVFFIFIFGCRFLLEFVKENQVSFEQQMTLNMGQLLSIPAVLIGLLLIIYSSVSKGKKDLRQKTGPSPARTEISPEQSKPESFEKTTVENRTPQPKAQKKKKRKKK